MAASKTTSTSNSFLGFLVWPRQVGKRLAVLLAWKIESPLISKKISANGDTSQVNQVANFKWPQTYVMTTGYNAAVVWCDRHKHHRVLMATKDHGNTRRIFIA